MKDQIKDQAKDQLKAAAALSEALKKIENTIDLSRESNVLIYNPLTYAWPAFEEYVTRYGTGKKRVVFLGMNPGPWGMAQTGVPFGEVSVVRDWLGISAPIGRPRREHPRYPVDGYACKRSEVSGRRLWGLFKERFDRAEDFFREHFVVNYCPLLFSETYESATHGSTPRGSTTLGSETPLMKNGKERARNLTPDKLNAALRALLYEACDAHLKALIQALSPQYVIGVGNFAEARIAELSRIAGLEPKTGKILHPSPASPRSNSDWKGEATRQLIELGVW
jgi:single-strand selective monofunctional uracil DNA glycosylase